MRERLARAFPEAVTLVLVAVVVGLVSNQFSARPASLQGGTPAVPVLSQLTVPQARSLHQAGSMLFLDARDPVGFAGGHIPQALSLPASDLAAGLVRLEARLQEAAGLVVYCDHPDGAPTRQTAQGLSAAGYGNIYLLPGGWVQWTAAGLPVEHGAP